MQQSTLKHAADGVAATGIVAALVGWLPAIGAVLSIIWFTIQITEKVVGKPFSEIVRCLFARFRRG